MTVIFDKLIKPAQAWYQSSTIKEFMDWWLGELKSVVPDRYQQQFFNTHRSLLVLPKGEEVSFYWQQEAEVSAVNLNEDRINDDWWHQINYLTASEDREPAVRYLLPESKGLVRTIALPVAAMSNLESALSYEMDKYMPFGASEVAYAYKAGKVEEGMDKFPVALVVVRKKDIDQLYKNVSSKGVVLSAIDINLSTQGEPRPMGVNLLDEQLRKRKDWSLMRFNLILSFIALALLVFVMYGSLNNKQTKLDDLTIEVKSLREQARTAKELEARLKDSILAASFLSEQRNEKPYITSIMTELTSTIPMDSHMTRITINNGKMDLEGLSDNANALVPILNRSSQWYSPEISNQVTPDSRTGKEKFVIKASLVDPKLEEGGDVST